MKTFAWPILAACFLLACPARADQLLRKGGEWRSTVTGMAGGPQTMDMCFSQTTMEQAMSKLAGHKNCGAVNVKLTGNVFTLDIACGAMSMQGTATILSDSEYNSDLTMHFGASPNARTIHAMTTAKWIGACKPGERPMN